VIRLHILTYLVRLFNDEFFWLLVECVKVVPVFCALKNLLRLSHLHILRECVPNFDELLKGNDFALDRMFWNLHRFVIILIYVRHWVWKCSLICLCAREPLIF
jgi:hypothetical protein